MTLAIHKHARSCTQHTVRQRDGAELFYRAWLPEQKADKALFLFHRGHEHSGRFQDLVDRLELDDVAIFAWDARGHGRSPGERGYAHHFSVVIKDIDTYVRHVCREHEIPLENVVLLGHSVGAVAVAAWVHDYAPPICGMVLATPALRVKLYVPLAIPGLRLLQKFKSQSFVKSYVKPQMLTHDAEMAADYASDELISRNIAVNILLDLYDTSTRLLDDAAAIRVPTLVMVAGNDWVVRRDAQQQFYLGLGSPHKELVDFPGFYHSIFQEQDRERPIAKAREFIQQCFARGRETEDLTHADQQGYTRSEYDHLREPLSVWSPKRWGYAALAGGMKTLGRLSWGIQLGWQTGFDSGQSLDHVYRNRPKGISPLGRLFDRFYLDSTGWAGIRHRKEALEQLLDATIEQVHAAGRPVRIVDIASGPGRYLLETVKRMSQIPIEAVCRDRSAEGLAEGRKLAETMGVENVRYAQGDAFDPESLAAITPRPTIAIVSGLYELFPNNAPVQRSLSGLARAVEPGGYLIYTNQPWHPQVELIARSLTNRDGQPWIMRRRTQAEMDQLVSEAGFEKFDMLTDPAGIFTVSVATRANRD